MPKEILSVRVVDGEIHIGSKAWPGFSIGPMRPVLGYDGKESKPNLAESTSDGDGLHVLSWRCSRTGAELRQEIRRELDSRFLFSTTLTNGGKRSFKLNKAGLYGVKKKKGASLLPLSLGRDCGKVRILEQNTTGGQTRSVGQIRTSSDGRTSLAGEFGGFSSNGVTLFFHPERDAAVVVEFTDFRRFMGFVSGRFSGTAMGTEESILANVDKGAQVAVPLYPQSQTDKGLNGFDEFEIYSPGGDITVDPGEIVHLPPFVVEAGGDPFTLLESYANRLNQEYRIGKTLPPFVSWCSWYAFRLGVSEDHVLKVAEMARQRHLDKLGMRYLVLDLGWEKDNLPTYFEENERFSHGLGWLSARLREGGFDLGAWVGFTGVSENHPIAKRHEDWLVHDQKGKPSEHAGKWFWPPHDRMFILDVSHPGAREWVRKSIESLAARGVRYLKWDFGGMICCTDVTRHDPKIACSQANEGMRALSTVISEALDSAGEKTVVLDNSGNDFANLGNFGLFHACPDTGNTGIGYAHLRKVFSTAGAHTFKQHRIGLLHPSCLVLHGPGSIEEARIRATVAYLMAGHIDISDDLATLPEERWRILKSLLPIADKPARPVDLYYPVLIGPANYVALCKGERYDEGMCDEPQGASVWHLNVQSDWDAWNLVAIVNYFSTTGSSGTVESTQFDILLQHLGMRRDEKYWAHEFWSEMFLGSVPIPQGPTNRYRHPGDYANIVVDSASDKLRVIFNGPAVKLLVVRRKRNHPWPVATTFHQSGGVDLKKVRWDSRRKILSGILTRSPSESGHIVVAGVGEGGARPTAVVGGAETPITWGANGSVHIPVVTADWQTPWELRIGRQRQKPLRVP